MSRPDGMRSGNPDVRKDVANKVPQHVAWAAERPGGAPWLWLHRRPFSQGLGQQRSTEVGAQRDPLDRESNRSRQWRGDRCSDRQFYPHLSPLAALPAVTSLAGAVA